MQELVVANASVLQHEGHRPVLCNELETTGLSLLLGLEQPIVVGGIPEPTALDTVLVHQDLVFVVRGEFFVDALPDIVHGSILVAAVDYVAWGKHDWISKQAHRSLYSLIAKSLIMLQFQYANPVPLMPIGPFNIISVCDDVPRGPRDPIDWNYY